MSPEERTARTEVLYGKSVRELIEIILSQEEEIQEAKVFRSKLIKIRNILSEPDEKRRQGRPKAGEKVI